MGSHKNRGSPKLVTAMSQSHTDKFKRYQIVYAVPTEKCLKLAQFGGKTERLATLVQ